MARFIVNPRMVTTTVQPAAEPVSLAQIKSHLRIDHTDEDAGLLPAIIQAAREVVEISTGRALVERTLRADLPGWADEIVLPWAPLQSVTSVKYYNTASPQTLTTLSDTTTSPIVTSQIFRVDARGNRLLRVSGESWPSCAPRHDAVQITYKAGHAPTGSPLDYTAPVEESLRSAVLLIAGDLYENREGGLIGQGLTPVVNKSVEMLLSTWRVVL